MTAVAPGFDQRVHPNPQSTGGSRRTKPFEPSRIPRPNRGRTPQIPGRNRP
jgi:hypothetical protein